jgi:ABC-2 type transport system ATP-binding protein
MTQRLGLARVLLHDPEVLLLDEPASGLDPRARIEMRALLKELRRMGKTILVSSHILPELADICNKIGIIERGELLVNGAVVDVMKRVRDHTVLHIHTDDRDDEAAKLLERQPSVSQVEVKDRFLSLRIDDPAVDYSFIPTLLLQHGFKLRLFREEEINLEDAFMALTKGITN